MTATVESIYQAKRIQLDRILVNLSNGSTMYTQEAVATLFESMEELFPADSKVTATHYKSIFDTEPVVFEGTVLYSVKLDDSEPCFEIENEDGEFILLRGSLLTLTK